MNKPKVLFLDKTHPVLPKMLKDLGLEIVYKDEWTSKHSDNLSEFLGIIVRSKVLDENFMKKFSNLKFIGRVGAGMENIDLEYTESKSIQCVNSPEGNRDAVGEHTLGMLLNLTNRLNIADHEMRCGKWRREENRGHEIGHMTIGIFGYGNMGSAFAEKISGFNARVIGYDKYKKNYSNHFVEEVNLKEFFKAADVVSFHIPLTQETEFLVNNVFINQFQKDIYILNTSRGKILKTADLVQNLETGKVKGAALDVFEYESSNFETLFEKSMSPDFQYLMKSNKVILTPHIAGWTYESKYKLAMVVGEKITTMKKNGLF
jgi:D-3-phosphoglycerate dehydrogenase